MNQPRASITLPLAAIIASVVIGVAILVALRWEIAGHAGQPVIAYRLDRWTGTVAYCQPSPQPRKMICE